MKRFLKMATTAVLVTAFVFSVVSFAAWWLLDLDAWMTKQLAAWAPRIEAEVGRKVTTGRVSTTFLPTLSARVSDIELGPDAQVEGDLPLVRLGSVSFELSLWDAIKSFGKQVTINQVAVDGVQLNVTRHADGSLSYADVLARLATREVSEEPKPESGETEAGEAQPLSPEMRAWLQGASVEELRLTGAVRFIDETTKVESRIEGLRLTVSNVRLGAPVRVALEAAVFAAARNFRVSFETGVVGDDLDLSRLSELSDVRADLVDVDLARLAPYLALPVSLEQANLSLSFASPQLSTTKPSDATGTLTLSPLRLGGGQRCDVSVTLEGQADPTTFAANVRRFDVAWGGARFALSGAFEHLASSPAFSNLQVKGEALDLDELRRCYPALPVPRELRAEGPGSFSVAATGDANRQTVQATVNLRPVRVAWGEVFEKPRGEPFALSVDGTFSLNDAHLAHATLSLGELELGLKGKVMNFAAPKFDFVLQAKPFGFESLAHLVPGTRESMKAAGVTSAGRGAFDGYLKGAVDDIDAKLALHLSDVGLDVPGTSLAGKLDFLVQAKGNPSGDFDARMSLDATDATIELDGLVDKPKGVDVFADVRLKKQGDGVEFPRFDVRFADLSFQAKGGADLAKGTTNVSVAFAPLDLEKFARIVPAIPSRLAKGGLVRTNMSLSGNPNELSTLVFALDGLDLKLGTSDLRGTVRVQNLVTPQATVALRSNLLDVDALFPPESERADASPAQGVDEPKEAKDDPSLKAYGFAGTLSAKRIRLRGRDLTDFQARMHLKDGRFVLDEGGFGLYGGRVEATGSEADVWRAKMPFRGRLALRKIDVGALLAGETKWGGVLSGRGTFDLDVKGEGFETADLEKSLTGIVSVSLDQAAWTASALAPRLTSALEPLEKIPGLTLGKLTGQNAIRNLFGTLEVTDGRMTFKEPATLSLDGYAVTLEGAMGVAGGLFLDATWSLPGKLIGQVTGGRCRTDAPLPIPMTLGGTFARPDVAVAPTTVVKALAQACLVGKTLDQVEGALGVDVRAKAAEVERKAEELVERAQKEAQAARERAEAEVARAKAEAEERARAEAARLKAEAEERARAEAVRVKAEADAKVRAATERAEAEARAKAEEAKREAEKKAKEKLGDALGGIRF